MDEADVFQRAKEDAINFLSYRPRSSKEVRGYLIRKGHTSGIADSVVAYLQERGYIDDGVFARKWYKTRMLKGGFGPVLISRELRAKGIGQDVCDRLKEEFYAQDTEREEAEALLLKKGWHADMGLAEKRRFYNMLIRRGFSSHIIKEIFLSIEKGIEKDL